VIAEVPCNWLQCQENTVDPVHFEWMHNNQPQRMAGDLGPYSPKTLKLAIEETEFGLISRRYREGNDETAPLWSVGRAILWPNGWYFGHHFEWKVPIDDGNTLFINWCTLHVPSECEPYVQQRIPTWYAPTIDSDGRWITSHVSNQDIVAWISQGRIADRTQERLGTSDLGVVAMRRQFFNDLDAIAHGKDPKGVIRDPQRNSRIALPCVGREDMIKGLPREQMLNHPILGPFLRDFFLLAGQPSDVKEEFEQATGSKQTELRVHELVFR
jgi:5,5'-dehydrodivanillate O-demethylase